MEIIDNDIESNDELVDLVNGILELSPEELTIVEGVGEGVHACW